MYTTTITSEPTMHPLTPEMINAIDLDSVGVFDGANTLFHMANAAQAFSAGQFCSVHDDLAMATDENVPLELRLVSFVDAYTTIVNTPGAQADPVDIEILVALDDPRIRGLMLDEIRNTLDDNDIQERAIVTQDGNTIKHTDFMDFADFIIEVTGM